MKCLPIQLVSALEPERDEERWLVDKLWADCGVGIVGGEPKCCKSFLALELSVAVASGSACFGRFAVERAGPVLLFAAEDSTRVVRTRIEGIAAARGVRIEDLAIHVITATSVRLDLAADRELLRNTVASVRPRLLVLDPFVRLHRVDENASGEVAPLLAYLRELNRAHGVAVAVVHHARKGGAGQRAGQALRGTSEFHAWGDSNLYLARQGDRLTLAVEHRASASIDDVELELRGSGDAGGLALELVSAEEHRRVSAELGPEERVVEALRAADGRALRVAELRRTLRMRAQTLADTLRRLMSAGRIQRDDSGYRLLE